MALYPPITLVTDIVTTTPGDDEVVCKLPDAQRQMKAFLASWLLQAHNADGTIKALACKAGTFDTGAIVGAAAGTPTVAKDIAANSIYAVNLAAKAVTSTVLSSSSSVDADRAVGTDHIKDASITAVKLAGSITAAAFAANSVTSTILQSDGSVDANRAVNTNHIKDDAVTAAKIADGAVLNATVADNVLTPVKLANPSNVATTSNPYLPVIAGTSSVGSKAAAIGGVLTATLGTVGGVDTLIFANSALGSTMSFGWCEEGTTSGMSANGDADAVSTWNNRGSWSAIVGSPDVLTVGTEKITITTAGTYLIWFDCPAYSVGAHQAMLCSGSAPTYTVTPCIGNRAYAPPGHQSSSSFVGLLSVATDSTILTLKHWCQLAQPVNGKGLSITDAGPTAEGHAVYARFACIKL